MVSPECRRARNLKIKRNANNLPPLKKILTIWLTIIIATTFGGTQAQALITMFPENSGKEAACRGGRDWGTFISSVLSYDDFSEYWKDIFVRYNANICHYQDIDSLLNRISGIREQIRKAFYVCANTDSMKKTYYELEAELFFLRKYIKTDYSSFVVVADQKVIDELRSYFVINKGFLSDSEITDLFAKFKTKYAPRIIAYKQCTDPTWQSLVDKWNEFKSSAGGITPALNSAKQSVEKKWDRMKNTSMNLGRDFWGGFVDARINGLEPKEGWNQILDTLKKNSPSGGVTFQALTATKTIADQSYDSEKQEETYLAEYQTLYMETSDEFTKDIVAKLNMLNSIVQDTWQYQNQTIQCVKGINNKQC